MVSNASDDLPDPDTPVITVNFSWGIESEMFLRLWTRAPWIRIKSSTGVSIIRLRGGAPDPPCRLSFSDGASAAFACCWLAARRAPPRGSYRSPDREGVAFRFLDRFLFRYLILPPRPPRNGRFENPRQQPAR